MSKVHIEPAVYTKHVDKYSYNTVSECLAVKENSDEYTFEPTCASFLITKDNEQAFMYLDWGDLNILLLEMAEVVNRISDGKIGVIRHASMEGDIGMYLLFIPEGNSIRLFILEIEDPHEMHMCFPIPGYAGSLEQIYDFVEKWLKGEVKDVMVRKSKHMDELTIPATDLTTIFKTQIAVGLELLN